jgi:NAD dependent epimerase/dehydratase family enzyme
MRTVPVIDRASAPLKHLVPLFQLGLGAKLGDGHQFFPVVSLRDWTAAVLHLADHDSISGPANICTPTTPTNAEFTTALASALHRKALVTVPAFAIRVGAGDLAAEALGSVNVRPAVLEDSGFDFRDADVDDVIASGLAKLR